MRVGAQTRARVATLVLARLTEALVSNHYSISTTLQYFCFMTSFLVHYKFLNDV